MDEDVRPALAKKVPLSALPARRSLPSLPASVSMPAPSPPYSESFPVPLERKSWPSPPPRVPFPASPQWWSSPVRTGPGARHHPAPRPAHALDDRGTVRDQSRGDDSGTEPRVVQRHEFWPFGQYSCQLRLGQYSCQFLSARPQPAVFEDISVFLQLSPALVMGFRRFPVAVVSQRRWRSGSLRLPSYPRGKKAWSRPSVGALGEAVGEGTRTVPGRMGDDAVVCCWPTIDLGHVGCRRRAISSSRPLPSQ